MRIRVFIVCVIICHSVLSLVAQNRNDRFHGYGSGSSHQINGYFGPFVAFSNVEGKSAFDAGATGGVVFNNIFFIGLYGQKLLTKVPRIDLAKIGYPTFTDGVVNMIHAGGVFGYIHNTKSILNWGISGSAGAGKIELAAKGPTNKYEDVIYDDKILIVIPKLFVETKMTRWFKINISVGYRVIGMVNGAYENQAGETIPTFVQSDYSKPEFSISLLLGSFGFRSYLLK